MIVTVLLLVLLLALPAVYLYGVWVGLNGDRQSRRDAYDKGRSDAIQWMYENV